MRIFVLVVSFAFCAPAQAGTAPTGSLYELTQILQTARTAITPMDTVKAQDLASRTISNLVSLSMATEIDGVPEAICGARVALRVAAHLGHRHSFPSVARLIITEVRTVYTAWGTDTATRLISILDKQDAYLATKLDGEWPPNTGNPGTGEQDRDLTRDKTRGGGG